MDLFLYKTKLKQINTCKTIKELEELVRVNFNDSTKFASYDTDKEFNIKVLKYKLFKYSLNKFSERSKKVLPDMIYYRVKCRLDELLYSITDFSTNHYRNYSKFSELPSYETFINWLEFETDIVLPATDLGYEHLNKIIGDNPIHFTLTFDLELTYFDMYSTTLSANQQKIVYALNYKDLNFPDQPQTVWDLLIAQYTNFSHKPKQSLIDEQVERLEQHIKIIKSLRDINYV